MFHHFFALRRLKLAGFFLGLLSFLAVQQLHAQRAQKEGNTQLRVICVGSLADEQEVILASRGDDGTWTEHSTLKLRPAFISAWLPARAGQLHLAIRAGGELQSIGSFTYPSNTKRALAVLLPDPVKQTYSADVIEPAKLKFTKGSTLLVNYSSLPGAVILGALKTQVKSGERLIVKPQPEANGMYRMMVAYTDDKKALVPCYDRYISSNEDARDIVLLLPDPTLGLKVFSLSEFGPFD